MPAVETVLEHFGVKGMKWGVRKDRGGGSGPQPITTTHKPGGKVTASGGQNRPAHEDAKRAVALGQKAKASSSHSLSNEELSDLLKRLDMENRYAKLNPPKKNPGKEFAKSLLKELGNRELEKLKRGDLSTIDSISKVLASGGKHRVEVPSLGKHRAKK